MLPARRSDPIDPEVLLALEGNGLFTIRGVVGV
jgi:hypothetical protein